MSRPSSSALPSWTRIRRACVTLLSIPHDAALLFRATMPPFFLSLSLLPPLYSTPCNMFLALIQHGLRQRTIGQHLTPSPLCLRPSLFRSLSSLLFFLSTLSFLHQIAFLFYTCWRTRKAGRIYSLSRSLGEVPQIGGISSFRSALYVLDLDL